MRADASVLHSVNTSAGKTLISKIQATGEAHV
jgi:hypothetical protein